MNSGRRAFSLLELLVVMAIIVMLAGLTLPALGGARESARRCECASNARELVVAANVYAGDFRGLLPPGAADFLGNLTRWHGSRDHPSERFRPTGGSLSGYLGAEDTFDMGGIAPPARRCPSFLPVLRQLAENGAGFELSSGGYGYNNAFVGVQRRRVGAGVWVLATDRSGSLLASFHNPAKTICFSDAAFASDQGIDGVIEYSFVEPRFWPDLPGSRADPSMHFRHQGRASVGWLDTHVSEEIRTFSWSSGLFGVEAEQVGIGFIGMQDDNSLFGQN